MTTVASPVSVREQALGIIAEHLCRPAQVQDALGEIGGTVFVDLLLDLEEHFSIGLDIDELLPNGTVGVLVELVQIRAKGESRIYHWDDERAARALPMVRPPLRLAEIEPSTEAAQRPELPHGACASCGRCTTLNAGNVCLACFCDDKAARTPPSRLPPVAVPSDEAWERVQAVIAIEQTRRFQFGIVALLATLGGVASGLVWASLAGVL